MSSKTIILFRHAKSDWASDFPSDHERPLAKRGLKAAKAMGRLLSSVNQVPAVALCSTALRCRTTLELAMKAGRWNCSVRYHQEMYLPNPGTVLSLVQALPEEESSVILVGHEPAWSELAAWLIGGGRIKASTASMIRLDCIAASWKEVVPAKAELIWSISPRLVLG